MSKDPAFLFYSNDFYGGTRMMLPKERACYVDLMIYQHQNEFIPKDLERVVMFCNGIDEATLIATLKAKFIESDKGWYNERLRVVMSNRKEFAEKQSLNGKIGQFFKKAKKELSPNEYSRLKKARYNLSTGEFNELILNINNPLSKAMLIAMLKQLEDVNVIEDVNENEIGKNNNVDAFLDFNGVTISKQVKNPEILKSEAYAIIQILNDELGVDFPCDLETSANLRKLLSIGRYDLGDIEVVMMFLINKWDNDTMRANRNPTTMFNPLKFENYANAARQEFNKPKKAGKHTFDELEAAIDEVVAKRGDE